MKERHYYAWSNGGDRIDSMPITAPSAESAALAWAKHRDEWSFGYRIKNGERAIVKVSEVVNGAFGEETIIRIDWTEGGGYVATQLDAT